MTSNQGLSATLLTIGDEILIGETLDTNSHFIANLLTENGITINEKRTISDEEAHILAALQQGAATTDLIIMTGGLGPTHDDITKHTRAKFFNTNLRMDAGALADVERIFKDRKRPMLEVNRQQAMIPENGEVLRNEIGTAPGMWFREKGKVFVSLPGVPHEMELLMKKTVLPRLKREFQLPVIVHKYINTAGHGESYLAEKLASFLQQLPRAVKLAFLPGIAQVRLRLTAKGDDAARLQQLLEAQVEKARPFIEKYIFGYDNDTLESVLGDILRNKKARLATAESCTGGYVAQRITSVAGSSVYFNGATVAYANAIKMQVLNVQAKTLEQHGAVSRETVIEMVKGALRALQADYAIATSGIAGPGGGTPEKPVGTVWIAVGSEEKIVARQFRFPTGRLQNIRITATVAMEMLRRFLLGRLSAP